MNVSNWLKHLLAKILIKEEGKLPAKKQTNFEIHVSVGEFRFIDYLKSSWYAAKSNKGRGLDIPGLSVN